MFPNIQSGKKYTIGYIETKISFATKTQCLQFKELINMDESVLLCNGPHTCSPFRKIHSEVTDDVMI